MIEETSTDAADALLIPGCHGGRRVRGAAVADEDHAKGREEKQQHEDALHASLPKHKLATPICERVATRC